MSSKQDILDDVMDVKNVVVDNWDDILNTSDQIQDMITSGFQWLQIEDNIEAIKSKFENFELPDFDVDDPIPDGVFEFVTDQVKSTLDPILGQLHTLSSDVDPKALINLIEASLSDIPDIPNIPGLNMSTLKNIATALVNGGLSISFKDLPHVKTQHSQTASGESSLLETLFNGLADHFKQFSTQYEDTIQAMMTELKAVITDDLINSFKSSSKSLLDQLESSSMTTEELFNSIKSLLAQEADTSKEIVIKLITQLTSRVPDIRNMLSSLLTKEIDQDSELCQLYQAVSSSNDIPSLIEILSIVFAIPITIIGNPATGNNLDLSKSISQSYTEKQRDAIMYGILQLLDGVYSACDAATDTFPEAGTRYWGTGISMASLLLSIVVNGYAQHYSDPNHQNVNQLDRLEGTWGYQWWCCFAWPIVKFLFHFLILRIEYKYEDEDERDTYIIVINVILDVGDIAFEAVHLILLGKILHGENALPEDQREAEIVRACYVLDPLPGIIGSGLNLRGQAYSETHKNEINPWCAGEIAVNLILQAIYGGFYIGDGNASVKQK